MRLSIILVAVLTSIPHSTTFAHGGGLNRDGCHTNRKTGDYHCHRGPGQPSPSPVPASRATTNHAYRNCSEARAAGAAPVKRGDSGYGPHLDRDRDGVGCE